MIDIQLQNDLDLEGLPTVNLFSTWVLKALQKDYKQLEQVIRIVDSDEIQSLNLLYRDKDKPTNILSFPAEPCEFLDYDCLGDLVVCAEIVEAEAKLQNKQILDHWAHLIIHGLLHLQGFDHINDADAHKMETLEIKILEEMNISNPYNIVVMNKKSIK